MMSGRAKFKVETFTLFAHEKNRVEQISDLIAFVEALPIDKVFNVKVRKGEQGRREVANNLYQLAIGQVIKQSTHYHDPGVVAGVSKYHLLHPHKKIWAAELEDDALLEEAELEQLICISLAANPDFTGDKLLLAYDYGIRTSTLKVGTFARYLDLFLKTWARHGIGFDLRPNDIERVFNGGRES